MEKGIPVPSRLKVTSHGQLISLTESIKAMKVGESFVIDNIDRDGSVRSIAHRVKVKVRTEKVPLLGLRIHRIE